MKNSNKVLKLNAFTNLQITKAKSKAVKGGAGEIIITEVVDI